MTHTTKPSVIVPRRLARFFDGRGFFLLGAGLLLVSLVVLGFALRAEHNATARRAINPKHPFMLGQTVSLGSASVKVDHLTYGHGTSAFTAPTGQEYAELYLTVKNIADKPIYIAPATDTYVKNASGQVAYLTPYELAHPFHAGELLPGDTVSGQLSFLVKNHTHYTFYVDGIWSGGVLPFALYSN